MPLDSRLARLLHQRERVDLPTLQALLGEARANRDPRGEGLAQRLVQRGLLSRTEAEAYLAELRSVESSLGDTGSGVSSSQVDRIGWRPGGRVDDYRLLDRLGQGAMGVVFLAEHLGTGARYAVKAIPLDADEEMLERFRREGQAQAAVDAHPNVVRVHSAGAAAGHQYLVMDVVAGGDLEERLKAGRFPPREAAGLVAQLARGLAHVHSKGVLHRDLKPSNVLFDEAGTPKLADFGLVRLSGENRMTRTGDILGSPAYMAPEQAQGLGELDERTDVYGLGGILYQLLTGQPPFSGRTALEVLTKVLMERPTAPRKLSPDVPAQLEAICMRALARERADRFSSATELSAALEDYLALDREATEPAPRAGARLPLALLSAALLLGVVAGGGWLVFGGAGEGPSSPSELRRTARRPPTRQIAAPTDPPAAPEDAPELEAPLPPLPRPDWLAWRQGRGDRGRLLLVLEVDEKSVAAGIGSLMGSRRAGRLVFDWEVLGEDEKKVTLNVTVVEVRCEGVAELFRNSFDSTDLSQRDRPYAQVVGARFRLVVDRASGAVGPVRVSTALSRLLRDELIKGKREAVLGHVFGLFSDSRRLRLVFNRYFHLFREDLLDVSRAWDVVDEEDIYIRTSAANSMPMASKFVRRVSFEPQGDEGGRLTWQGALSYIRSEGDAVWEGGRLVRLKVLEFYKGQHRDVGAEKEVTTTYTFSNLPPE